MQSLPSYFYRQSAVIPFRVRGNLLEVLLITSRRRRNRWIVPKGVVEPGLTPVESAQKEAWEEAGVEGVVRGKSLGIYKNEKWGGTCLVDVYAMRVDVVHDVWPEDDRAREWVEIETATDRVQEADLQAMLLRLPAVVEEHF